MVLKFKGDEFVHKLTVTFNHAYGYRVQWFVFDYNPLELLECEIAYSNSLEDFPLLDEFLRYRNYWRLKQNGESEVYEANAFGKQLCCL
jgi:hypothetical protein